MALWGAIGILRVISVRRTVTSWDGALDDAISVGIWDGLFNPGGKSTFL